MTIYILNKLSLAVAIALVLSGCSMIQPTPISEHSMAEQGQQDRSAAQDRVEPIRESLSLNQAMARALKYNLDRRGKMMEEAIAFKQLDV